MGYNALSAMKDINRNVYGITDSVNIPGTSYTGRNYGREAVYFIRDNCEDLCIDVSDPKRAALADSDGRSSGPGQIPFNMERDLDRLSFEKAIGRFLDTGSREDAFDIYYCYCEIFRPFGAGYDSTGLLLELLSEHETNASSLLMKHRDHYSHSVYVFLLGLAIYRNNAAVRNEYNRVYGLKDGPEAACHFLKYWGITSLFHDIGYPFEIAHQQMKSYVCQLDSKNNNDDYGFAPYVSYRNIDDFVFTRSGDLNELFAELITERLEKGYSKRSDTEPYYIKHLLEKALKDRAVHANPNEKDYLYMDHAYFSAMILAKTYIARNKDIRCADDIPAEIKDALCAIILHNSLFKFTLRSLMHTRASLSLYDGQPLSYLLMLCDELQCWDRASYGQNSRGGIFAFDFDMVFENGSMKWTYFFDKTYEENVAGAKAYRDMSYEGYTKKSGAVRTGRCKFVDDIDEIIVIKDVIPEFIPDVKMPDSSLVLKTVIEEKKKKTGLYLSNSTYLNLYQYALALNGRYADVSTPEEITAVFEERLSLEYKLSNIAQAKDFAAQLNKINCFYTDRPVDYMPVRSFSELIKEPGHENDLAIIGDAEHKRWCCEKTAMGWKYGTEHVNAITTPDGEKANDTVMRERIRHHHDLVDTTLLNDEEIRKDTEPMELLLKQIQALEGAVIYKMK